MVMDIAALGDDTIIRGPKETGSTLLGSMTIGGK